MMGSIEVERLGGFAGFGGPGSRLQSRGTVNTSDLSDSEKQAVEDLFVRPSSSTAHASPDAFTYRLTRETPVGSQSVDVMEHEVPQALKAAVKDRIA